MSLSQKHPGLVLVPWYNIDEWKHVSNLICSDDVTDWSKALERLKIWKLRTSLLSAGVEGTLIVFEALLVDSDKLNEYEMTNIYSMSLLRFLNIICAATSEKQGTFYKQAKQSDLPKWLVNVRHDIAHGAKLPSRSLLYSSLQFCLNWLREKYWNVQMDVMDDFHVNETVPEMVESAMDIYCFFKYKEFFGEEVVQNHMGDSRWNEIQHEIEEKSSIISKGNRKLKQNSSRFLELLRRIIGNGISANQDWAVEKLSSKLLDQHYMLSIQISSESTDVILPEKFALIWAELLSEMYNNEILDQFLIKLFTIVNDISWRNDYRELASLWIKKIFKELDKSHKDESDFFKVKQKKEDCCVYRNYSLLDAILYNPSLYSLKFLEQVLKFYEAKDKDKILYATKLYLNVQKPTNTLDENRIYTLEDLNKSDKNHLVVPERKSITRNKSSKWRRIEDVSKFKNLPLGVLPGLSRDKNPFVDP